MRCPECGFPNREGAVICDHCRARLGLSCPRCGYGVDEDTAACPRCGQAVSGGRAAPSAAQKQLFVLGGRYQVMQQVSRSRTSAVYRALDRSTGATVAVKRLDTVALVTPEEKRSALAQFDREATMLEQLRHSGIVPVLAHFREKESVYVVMAWVTGSTLAEVRLEGPLTEPQVRVLGRRLAEAIAYLHSQSPAVILRDLKPSHIMIAPDGQPVVLDLGLSRLFRAGQSRGEANSGTPPFEAPEQKGGGYAGPQSDVYALATLLLVLVRGPKGSGKIVSPTLRRAIAHARREDPDKRTQSMERFARALSTREDLQASFAPPAAHEPEEPSAPAATDPAPFVAPAVHPKPAMPASATVLTRRLRVVRRPGRMRAGYRLHLRNDRQEPVEVRVRSGVPWLTVPSDPIRLEPGSEQAVTVRADLSLAPAPGTRVARAVLLVDGSRRWVPAEVVEPPPSLVVETQELDFGTVGPQGGAATLRVRNDGGGRIPIRISPRYTWLSPSRPELALESGQAAEIEMRLRGGEAPEPGRYEGAVLVDTDIDQVPVDVTFNLGRPELRLHRDTLAFGSVRHPGTAEAEIVLSNTGSAPASVRFSSTHEALSLSHGEVTLPAKHRARVKARLDTKGLPAGKLVLRPAVRIGSPAGSYQMSLEAEVVRPLLAVSETEFDLGSLTPEEIENTKSSLLVSNRGNTELDFDLEPQVPWLRFEPQAGRLSGGASTLVDITLSRQDAQQPGLHEGRPAALVRSQGGTIPLAVSFRLIRPQLAVEPPSVDFGLVSEQGVGERHLTVSNHGTGSLKWTARTDAAWLETVPSSGECPEGTSVPVVVRAYGLALPTGTDQAKANLVFDGPYNRRLVPVTVALSRPILVVEPVADLPDSVDLAPVGGQIILFNRGAGDLRANVASTHPNVTVAQPDVVIGSGRSAPVEVVLSPEADWEPGPMDLTGALQVTSNGGTAEVDLRFRLLVRAKYSLSPDRLVLSAGMEGAIILRNLGRATLEGTVRTSADWLKVQPGKVTVRPGRRARLQVGVAPDVAAIENDTATVTVAVADTTESVEVSITS